MKAHTMVTLHEGATGAASGKRADDPHADADGTVWSTVTGRRRRAPRHPRQPRAPSPSVTGASNRRRIPAIATDAAVLKTFPVHANGGFFGWLCHAG